MDWNDLSSGVATTLLANIILTTAAGLTVLILGRFLWRRRIRSFFGVDPDNGSLPIFLSNINVQPLGTKGTSQIVRGYTGAAITEIEYLAALQFASSVETRPSMRALQSLDRSKIVRPVEPIICAIQVSPNVDQLGLNADVFAFIREKTGNTSVLIVGAPIYNTLSWHLMTNLPSRYEFTRDEGHGISYLDKHQAAHPNKRTDPGGGGSCEEFYIVERLNLPVARDGRGLPRYVFICAGTCSAATAAAVQRLTEWRALRGKYRKRENFGVMRKMWLASTEMRERLPQSDDSERVYYYGGKGEDEI